MQLKLAAFLLLAVATETFGLKKPLPPRLRAARTGDERYKLGVSRDSDGGKPHDKPSNGGCGGGLLTTTAPKKNIFGTLSDDEYADVTAFLHKQKKLNLTAVANATSYVLSFRLPAE